MPEISLSEWNAFLSNHSTAHLLQSGEWGQLKSAFGWEAVHMVEGETGAQILFRRLPVGIYLGLPSQGTGNRIHSRALVFGLHWTMFAAPAVPFS